MFLLITASILCQTLFVQSESAQNCQELQNEGLSTSGVYSIQRKFSSEPSFIYCDMELLGGGWTYILNRFDGSIKFDRFWEDYKHGFGNTAGELWLGLDHIHELTGYELNELLVELVDWNDTVYHEHYKAFSIAGEKEDYRLQILGKHSGDLGDSLYFQIDSKFTTADKDNDYWDGENCSKNYGGGGWWYSSCYLSQLTGKYLTGDLAIDGDSTGIVWRDAFFSMGYPTYYSFKEARMMVRPQINHNVAVNC